MIINSRNDLLIATKSLNDVSKQDINDFISALAAASSFEEIEKAFEDIELSDDSITFLVKHNAQHIVASVKATKKSKKVIIELKCYD